MVAGNASPTIMNNILAYLRTGIQVTAGAAIPATEIGHNLFQGNTNDGATGSFAFTSTDPDPDTLFVNASLRNFYLVSGVPAIDSSLNRADDRTFLANVVKAPLGIPPSAIVAPERDVFGQVRADDEDTDPLGGGSLVFKDRGAVERVDLDAPFAALVNPADGDSQDRSPVSTVVYRVDEALFSEFTLQLFDGPGVPLPIEGTGVDAATVTPLTVSMTQDGVLLVETTQVRADDPLNPADDFEPRASDFALGYDGNQVLKLTPDSGTWEPGRTYVITLNNRDRYVLTAPDGAADRGRRPVPDPGPGRQCGHLRV